MWVPRAEPHSCHRCTESGAVLDNGTVSTLLSPQRLVRSQLSSTQSVAIKGSRSSTQCCGAVGLSHGGPLSPCCGDLSLAPVLFNSALSNLFSLFSAVGCAVGPWGPWSGCSSPCGVGSKDRSRQVTVPPRHGGEPCPDLKQRRGCLGDDPACGAAKGNAGPPPSPAL